MVVNLITPIRVSSLSDVVADRLRQAIITGELGPGERLSEPGLAAQLGISRSPVREALQNLKSEGLVVERSNRSNYVWAPTLADIEEIFSLRIMIETLASEWLANHLTSEDVRELEETIEKERLAIAENDLFAIIDTDRQFHQYICYRANHSRLRDWWNQLMGQWEVVLYKRLTTRPDLVLSTVIQDHQAILEAMKSRDLDQVTELHRSINDRVSANIKQLIQEESNP